MHCRALPLTTLIAGCAVVLGGCSSSDTATSPTEALSARASGRHGTRFDHVLLISVDGLHASDLLQFIGSRPASALAKLAHLGTTYAHASTAKPSDSFPGLLAMLTGGSPATTGVWYDDSYDRRLSPPGSACATVGTEVVFDESIDKDLTALAAGGGIDPAALPLDPAHGCVPVYPHSYLRVNTIFEVAKAAGLRTAWSDKHPSYDLVNGPSGHGVDDLYTPEIASNAPLGGDWTAHVQDTEKYDDFKVQAIVNEIDGKDHAGTVAVGVPAIFGMNFQAVSVGQKTLGYLDAAGTPTPGLADALAHTDASIGRFVDELKRKGLIEKTLIIISAKHGQSPIDPAQRRIINKTLIPGLVNGVQAGLLAQATQDDISLLWLTDQSKTSAVVTALNAHASEAGIGSILSGASLIQAFDDPTTDSRTPDIIGQPEVGVIYTSLTATKLAEHGGFSTNDTEVPILVAAPGLNGGQVSTSVDTRQIAPTILAALGLNPGALQAVATEATQQLPGLSF